MDFFREFMDITLEICLAIFIIIFGYAIWNSFNFFDYQAANIGDNIKEVEVMIDNNILYLHNIAKSDNDVNLLFKIRTNDINESNSFILEIQNKKYNLKKIERGIDKEYNYYTIDNINFKKYETKDYKFKILRDTENFIYYEFFTV